MIHNCLRQQSTLNENIFFFLILINEKLVIRREEKNMITKGYRNQLPCLRCFLYIYVFIQTRAISRFLIRTKKNLVKVKHKTFE
jgi:hypothetical protein